MARKKRSGRSEIGLTVTLVQDDPDRPWMAALDDVAPFEGLTAEQVAQAQAAVAQWPPLPSQTREELRALFTEQ
jgi:hypothetical protein